MFPLRLVLPQSSHEHDRVQFNESLTMLMLDDGEQEAG